MSLHGTARTANCKVNLLLKPTYDSLKVCDVRYVPYARNQWSYLRTEGSVIQPATLQLICSLNTEIIRVQGTGLLKFPPHCIGKTDELTLPILKTFNQTTQYFYQPRLDPNLLQLFPKLQPHVARLNQVKSYLENASGEWGECQEGKSIEEILAQLNELEIQRRDYQLSTGLGLGG